jgi:hypothetical protein
MYSVGFNFCYIINKKFRIITINLGTLCTGFGSPAGCMNSDMYHHTSGKQGMLPDSHDSVISMSAHITSNITSNIFTPVVSLPFISIDRFVIW